MFALAILIGIYSYIIFALGIIGLLYKAPVIIFSILFFIGAFIYFKKHKEDLPRLNFRNKKIRPLLILFGIFALVNLIGALGPEISFDALWYHLSLPKVFIQEQKIFFIEGNVFYYSLMPKLGEMLFTPLLMFGNETLAKLTQWVFGILTCIVIYKISRKYFGELASFFAVLVFYGSLVVAWESTVAYIDLIRAFFEIMGLWGFLNWYETRDRKWLVESAVMIGFAISTKTLGLGSLLIFSILFLTFDKDKVASFKNIFIYSSVAILTAIPYFVFAFINSGNPVYPFFDSRIEYSTAINLNPFLLPGEAFNFFLRLADPISPLYLIFFPLVILYFKKFDKPIKLIAIYSIVAFIVWYLTPRTGGGRFILPYLPAFSIVVIAGVEMIKNKNLKKYSYALIILVFLINCGFRFIANFRFAPVVFGSETKDKFLTENLNFKFGDFYDTDGFFRNNIGKDDKVLLFGFHNLFYADFPFLHSSFASPGDKFNFIATQDAIIPERFNYWKLVHVNEKTGVNVYSLGGVMWEY